MIHSLAFHSDEKPREPIRDGREYRLINLK
jgi:hypothetical protein